MDDKEKKIKMGVSPTINPDDTRNVLMHKYAEASQVSYDYLKYGAKATQKLFPHLNIDHELSDELSVVIHYPKNNEVAFISRGTMRPADLLPDLGIVAGAPEIKSIETVARGVDFLVSPFVGKGFFMGEYDAATEKYNKIKEKYPDSEIFASGHSKGGSVGLWLAREHDLKSFTYNTGSIPHGSFIRRFSARYPVGKNIHTMYNLEQDVVSNLQKFIPRQDEVMYVVDAGCSATGYGCRAGSSAPGHSLGNFLHPKYKKLRPELFSGVGEAPTIRGDAPYKPQRWGFPPQRIKGKTNEIEQRGKPVKSLIGDRISTCPPNDPYCKLRVRRVR